MNSNDESKVYSRPSLSMSDIAAEITRLNVSLIDMLRADTAKDQEIAALQATLNRQDDNAREHAARLHGHLFYALSNLVGGSFEVRESVFNRDLRDAEFNCTKGVVGFKIPFGENDHLLKFVAIDLDTYEPGDADFSGVTPDVARHLVTGGYPTRESYNFAMRTFRLWEEWWEMHKAKVGETVEGVNAGLSAAGSPERVEPLHGTADETAGLSGDRMVNDPVPFRDKDLADLPVTTSEPVNVDGFGSKTDE